MNSIISNNTKKPNPISIITGINSLFKKKKLNNVAASYLETSQKLQNFQKKKKALENNNQLNNLQSNHYEYSTNIYNTFNLTLYNSTQKNNRKKKNKISYRNFNKTDIINSFNFKTNNSNLNRNLNLTSINKSIENKTLCVNEGINHYNHTKSFTKNYLINKKNTIIKNNNLRQFRQKIQRRILILMNNENKFSNNSVGKNKNKTKRYSLILKEISFNNSKIDKSISQKNYPNKKVSKMSFERVIDHKYKKKMNNNNMRIKPKKMFKKFFEKKNIEVATNIKLKDKQKVSQPLRAKIRTNKLSHGISNKRNNLLKKNSINKSTTITTSRTEISIEKEDKKHDDENFIFKNQVNKNKILNFVSFMKENNNKRIVCKSKEFRRRINSSFEKKDNSFENIINVLTVNPEEILD